VPIEWLADLLSLIHATPFLDWQLLTKRPENWKARIEAAADSCPERARRATPAQLGMRRSSTAGWTSGSTAHPRRMFGSDTVEDQTRADSRIPALLSIPAKVRFLSCEPLLGPVHRYVQGCDCRYFLKRGHFSLETLRPLDWVIAAARAARTLDRCTRLGRGR
jgi:protein gp37